MRPSVAPSAAETPDGHADSRDGVVATAVHASSTAADTVLASR
jgi:hypothetical protein